MASIGFLIGGALVNALAFSGSNFLLSSLSKESIEKEQKRHDKAIEDLQRAQMEWARKRQERLDYINNQIMKQRKAEKRFADLNSAMQQYFIVTGRRLEPLPPKPVLSNFYVPSEDHHNRELAFITLSMVGIGAFLWYSDKYIIYHITRGRGGLTHRLHSGAPAGSRRMAMTFARLRLIVFLWCVGLDWMPL